LIIAGVVIVYSGMRHRTKVLEMMHRERLAMIERGVTPSGDLEATPQQMIKARRTARGNRLLSAGIVVVGLGLALATLIAFASREPELAIGIGGAVALLGGSLIVTSIVVHGRAAEDAFRDESLTPVDRSRPPGDRPL
jgi:hypothetical protein